MSDNPFASLPMPSCDVPEPMEIDIQRIKRCMEEGRFEALSADHQRWVCRRLLPSLTRYGVYPPPSEHQSPPQP